MARIDSILAIVVQQGATELRVGTDRPPKMFAHGAPKRLAIPTTSDDTLRHLMGEILTADRESTLREKGRLDVTYEASSLGAFQVTLTPREAGFDAVFVRSAARARPKGLSATDGATPASPSDDEADADARGPRGLDDASLRSSPISARRSSSASGAEASPDPAEQDAAALPTMPRLPPARGDRIGGPTAALASLLTRAADARASDVHLMDGEAPSIRVDGSLRPLDDEAPADVHALLGDLLDGTLRARILAGQSVDLAFELPSLGRFRMNVYRVSSGSAAAIRLLARTAPTLAALHLPVPLEDLVDLAHGLVLVCGPTGSGKSTTLAALADEALRKRKVMLITLEDPIEYVLSPRVPGALVRQRQVGRDVRDFATGLRDALREDPDVLLIGEMRDPETISLALTAAETGHLVLASLHSRGTASACERIIDAYPPERQHQIRVQLADALRAVVAQRLLPRARGGGRTAALEVLRVTHSVASVIREGKLAQIASALQSGRREGMIALERCLADLVQTAQVTLEDARAVSNEPGSLSTYLGR